MFKVNNRQQNDAIGVIVNIEQVNAGWVGVIYSSKWLKQKLTQLQIAESRCQKMFQKLRKISSNT